jgi:hypothetical protein
MGTKMPRLASGVQRSLSILTAPFPVRRLAMKKHLPPFRETFLKEPDDC